MPTKSFRRRFESIEGLDSKLSRPMYFTLQTPIEVEIFGYNLEKLKRAADELEASLGSGVVVLDARSADRYAHGAAIDPRPGHVPGARSAPSTDNMVDGRLRSAEDLAGRYGSLGADGDAPVVAYCGSGVSACIDLLALRRAGLPDGRLFVGSWSAWGADPDRPAEEGPDRG